MFVVVVVLVWLWLWSHRPATVQHAHTGLRLVLRATVLEHRLTHGGSLKVGSRARSLHRLLPRGVVGLRSIGQRASCHERLAGSLRLHGAVHPKVGERT